VRKFIVSIFFMLLVCSSMCVSAQNNVMKISMSGETKLAKEIGNGKGITFTLPDLDSDEFYIYAIELAVFEKQQEETSWHIYLDDEGKESKKRYIEKPESLTFSVDFGNTSDYRDMAKYKIGYRYYVKSIYDESCMMISGEEEKEGWRLVGETSSQIATDNGFMFYKNATPEMYVSGFSYKYHHLDGLMTNECTPEALDETYFPADSFENGVIVQMIVNDFDTEDILSASYRLEDAITNQVVSEGMFLTGNTLATDYKTELFRLYITVSDNFGGSVTSDAFLFKMDTQKPVVVEEFDDGGFALKDRYLFSDFHIHDDDGLPMTDGTVMAYIYSNDILIDSFELTKKNNGVYELYKSSMPDGEYTVYLRMFDKAGNENEHYFYQTLDSKAPSIYYVTPEENDEATYYSKWMNESKKIILNVSDEYAGFVSYRIHKNVLLDVSETLTIPVKSYTIEREVPQDETGKLRYRFYVYDNAKSINKDWNKYKETTGNGRLAGKYVWIDKTKPTITTEYDETAWYEAPYVLQANFLDLPSSSSVDDASGVAKKQYAIETIKDAVPKTWKTYKDGVTLTDGGVYYVHFKATDTAGNTEQVVKMVKINTKARLTGRIRPTEDYKHTIYYSTPGFYVVKNTAYNTKYHFELFDPDVDDVIHVSAKLVSQDDGTIFGIAETTVHPNGTEERDIVFNMPYLDADLDELPDGVYDMLVTITEIKNDDKEVVTHTDLKDCEVVIKRNAPPTPEINTTESMVSIIYPDEVLSGSLNSDVIRNHYKCQYKAVRDGEAETNTYKTYTGEFAIDNFVVTALYTDIAGNVSVASKRIYKNAEESDDEEEIITSGNTITVEESRAADVYYIGIRRDKQSGINNYIFDFIE